MTSTSLYLRALAIVCVAGTLLSSLTGCGSGGTIPTNPVTPPPVTLPTTPTPGATFNGKVFAGTQPVIGASVQIYAAGAAGPTSTPTALLTAPLTTDANGAFVIPAGYPCPLPASQLYVIARGGKVGTAATANSSIALFTAIGACSALTASTQFVINEVTTAASAWALSQFISSGGQVRTTATNTVGLANAVATLGSLANRATGATPGPAFPSIGTSPAPRINSLANLLNACTASTAGNGSSSPCGQLFASTTVSGSAAPTDTLDAVINLVHHPAANVPSLYSQSAASTAFSPVLSASPSDWTLFVTLNSIFTDTTKSHYPSALGVDSTGSVWVADYFNAVAKFSPTGVPAFANITGNNLSDSYGLAIDARDNVWITNEPEGPLPGNSITVLNSSGQPVSGTTGYTGGGLNYPVGIAIDPNGTSWVVDYGNAHLTLLSATGAALSGTAGYTANSIAFPVAVAVDANHNGWIGDQNDGVVTRLSADGKTSLAINCCNGPNGLAIDQTGNVWVANFFGDSVSEISNSGTILANGTFTASGNINHPQAMAIDGSGNVWVGNYRAAYLTELAGSSSTSPAPGNPLSPSPGWAPDAKLFGVFAIAIDASGNLWITNANGNALTEFIGLATPVKTPLLGPPQTP